MTITALYADAVNVTSNGSCIVQLLYSSKLIGLILKTVSLMVTYLEY